MLVPLEEAVLLEREKVVVYRARGREADRGGDLADRGRVPALRDGTDDAVENPLPPLHVVSGQRGSSALGVRVANTLAERMF
jgi:hypothetical protein